MLVLLNAEDMVNPPMSNMIVGENICWKMYLKQTKYEWRIPSNRTNAHFVASGASRGFLSGSGPRSTWKQTSKSGTSIEVTNKGMACIVLSTPLHSVT